MSNIDSRIEELLDEMESNSKRYKKIIEEYEDKIQSMNKTIENLEYKASDCEKRLNKALEHVKELETVLEKTGTLVPSSKTIATSRHAKPGDKVVEGQTIILYNLETQEEKKYKASSTTLCKQFIGETLGSIKIMNNVKYELVDIL